MSENIEPITGEYDLFLCSSGFEDRSKSAIQRLSKQITVKQSLINLYEINEIQLFYENKKTLKQIKQIIQTISEEIPNIVSSNPSSVINFRDYIDRYFRNSKKVLIDITSFTRLYVYTLLYSLIDKGLTADILYSEPAEYTTNYTKGLEKIIIHPDMPGIPDQSKKVLMIMFLGWEVKRAESVLEEFDPDHLITIAEDSSDQIRKTWNDVTVKECQNIINKSEFYKIAPRKPQETLELLEKFYRDNSKNFDLCVLNVGPKYHCLAICEFAARHENVQVLYPKPYLWKQTKYTKSVLPISKGTGRTLLFRFPFIQQKS